MAQNRYIRPGRARAAEPRFGRLLMVSLGLHLLLFLLFSGLLSLHREAPKRPVYLVDLVNLPVADPQAGRPDAPAEKPAQVKKEPKPAPEPERPKPRPKPKPKPAAPEVVTRKAPPEPEKPAAEPKPKPKPSPQVAPKADYQDTLSAIDRLRQERERQERIDKLKRDLATMAEEPAPTTAGEAPLGMTDGRGEQAGIGEDLWLQTFLKENWSLSRYQVGGGRLEGIEATVRVTYLADGTLLDYRFLEKSRDGAFDESVKKAILKSRKLPFSPGRRLEKEIVFNLKDLLE